MRSQRVLVATAILALATSIEACTPDAFNSMLKRGLVEGPIGAKLVKRATCGPAAGGAICPAGQCCSSAGVCGTGGEFCSAPDCLFPYGPACDANKVPKGVSTANVPRPKLGSIPYGSIITTCTQPNTVALTFDDGPYIYTSALLDTLKASGVKATFFTVGINGGKGEIDDESTGYPAIFRRMIADGHQVASHSWSHQDMVTSTHQQRLDQMIKNEMAYTNILGYFPTYMRVPYVDINQDVLTDMGALGYHIINYDVDTLDWVGDYVAAKNNFAGPIANKNPHIILAHDIHQQTVTDLVPYMITTAKANGYTFATVGECLGDPDTNWYRDSVTGQSVGETKIMSAAAKQPTQNATSTVLPTASAKGNFDAAGSGKPSSAPTVILNDTVIASLTVSSLSESATASPSATKTGTASSHIYSSILGLSLVVAISTLLVI